MVGQNSNGVAPMDMSARMREFLLAAVADGFYNETLGTFTGISGGTVATETTRAETAEALALPKAGGAVTGDVTWAASTHGPVIADSSNGHTYRLSTTAGALVLTQVT